MMGSRIGRTCCDCGGGRTPHSKGSDSQKHVFSFERNVSLRYDFGIATFVVSDREVNSPVFRLPAVFQCKLDDGSDEPRGRFFTCEKLFGATARPKDGQIQRGGVILGGSPCATFHNQSLSSRAGASIENNDKTIRSVPDLMAPAEVKAANVNRAVIPLLSWTSHRDQLLNVSTGR